MLGPGLAQVFGNGYGTAAATVIAHVEHEHAGFNFCEVPSLLFEMGFMSNPDEDVLLCDPAYQDTLASAIALSRGCDGDFSVALRQPAGTVYASVTRQAGAVTAASIGGSVALEAPITVAI